MYDQHPYNQSPFDQRAAGEPRSERPPFGFGFGFGRSPWATGPMVPHGGPGDDERDVDPAFGFAGRGRFGPGRGRDHDHHDHRDGRGRRGPGGRRRRGDVRALLLAALADGDAHGYELIRRLEERSAGAWRPSAGSVYPTLQLLEEEGLVTGRDEEGKRVYTLTDAGRSEAERSRDGGAWDEVGAAAGQRDLRRHIAQLALAVKQVTIAGDADQIDKAAGILRDARQALYRLLAGD